MDVDYDIALSGGAGSTSQQNVQNYTTSSSFQILVVFAKNGRDISTAAVFSFKQTGEYVRIINWFTCDFHDKYRELGSYSKSFIEIREQLRCDI